MFTVTFEQRFLIQYMTIFVHFLKIVRSLTNFQIYEKDFAFYVLEIRPLNCKLYTVCIAMCIVPLQRLSLALYIKMGDLLGKSLFTYISYQTLS
jgi:hypothetical protein